MTSPDRIIRIPVLARVEGEGGLFVRLCGDHVEEVRLDIFEPPRLFESLLRGRHFREVPDITARICGICPIAYQMSSVHAIENAIGCHPGADIRRIRRLLYCGEWIQSHCLHMHLLHAPDFLGFESGLAAAAVYPDEIKRGLRLKKHANELMTLFGGRSIHPVNVTVGGFYRLPNRETVQRLIPDFEWGLSAAVEATKWVASLPIPDEEYDYDLISLVHPDEYPMNEGQITSTRGLRISASEFANYFREQQVPHSTALHCTLDYGNGPQSYLVGALSRVNHNLDKLALPARRIVEDLHMDWPCRNPHLSIVARGLEVIHAYSEALDILRDYRTPKVACVELDTKESEGAAATEAPRGLLYHSYRVGNDGLIQKATIIPPTSQNQGQIEADLRACVQRIVDQPELEIESRCERLVRSYDPCISCSTHFLRLTLERS